MATFHPDATKKSNDAISNFVGSPLSGDLAQVPGVGDSCISTLKRAGIENLYQLIAKYLSFKEDGIECVEHHEAFYVWLKEIGVTAHRATITNSIGEKMNLVFPGIFDSSYYA